MANEFRAKTFKSGNSVALRLPKSLGLEEGDAMIVLPHADGSFSMWKEDGALETFMSLYGSVSPGFMAGGRESNDQEAYDWDRNDTEQAA